MNNYILLLAMFLLYSYDNVAMQKPLATIESTIVKKIKLSQSSHAIAYDRGGKIIVMNNFCCTLINPQTESPITQCLGCDDITKSRIVVSSHHDNKLIDFDTEGCGEMVAQINPGNCKILYNCIKDDNTQMIFSSENRFWTILWGKLASYSFFDKRLQGPYLLSEYQSPISYEIPGINLGLLFSCTSSKREDSFLCCDDKKNVLYRLTPIETLLTSDVLVRELLIFRYKIDWNHWVYNPKLQLLCAINEVNKQLYIANTQTGKQKVFTIPNFKIGALTLHIDHRFLVLLSAQRDKICYFDSKKLMPLLITKHSISLPETEKLSDAQILACSPDGKNITILLAGKCLVVKIPVLSELKKIFKKYWILRQATILSQDLKSIIAPLFFLQYFNHFGIT